MIRWSYLAPRLLVVGGLMIFLGQGLDPLVRWSLVAGGQSVIGARVEVGEISSSLGHAQLAARQIAIANPKSPHTNAISAEYVWADLDGASLTRNRLIIDQAVVHGLKINAPRHVSGALETETEDDSDIGALGTKWLEDAAKSLGQDFADDLETVQKTRELRQRWPEEYRDLERRIDLWLAEVKRLEDVPNQLRGNVLEQAEQLRRAALTVRALREELAALRAEFQRLHQQARIDRTDLAEAAARDVEKTKQKLELAKLEPATLTDYFLGPELGPSTRETLQWIQWVRQQIPSSDLPPPERGRGRDIYFKDQNPQPWLLVRSLAADGEIHYRGKSTPFFAQANDWTVQPAVHGKPSTLKIKTMLPAESWMQLTVDRSSANRRIDRVTFVCPALPVEARTMGDDEYMAFSLPAGTIDVRANLTMIDDQIDGTIQLTRSDTSPALRVGSKLHSSSLASRLAEKSQELSDLHVWVTISGTLRRPKTSIASPLGEQIRDVLQDSLREELAQRQEELATKVRTEIDQEIQLLRDEVAAEKASVMRKLNLAGEQEQMIEELIARALGEPKGQLGRKLFQSLRQR